MFYTALPVLAIGVLDQDVNDSKSIMYPKLYTPGLENIFFNTKEFFKCAALGTYASLVIFFVPYGIYWILKNDFKSFHCRKIFFFFLGTYFYGMTSSGLNVLDHMYMAEVVAMILVTVMTIQVNRLNCLNKNGQS